MAGKTLIAFQGLQIAEKQHSSDEKFQMAQIQLNEIQPSVFTWYLPLGKYDMET